jgi:hypothetical protein
MSIINTPKPTTSLSNSTQPNKGETWASITTTWANEVRTWLQASKLITNINSILYQYLSKEDLGLLLQEDRNRLIISSGSFITNQARPA